MLYPADLRQMALCRSAQVYTCMPKYTGMHVYPDNFKYAHACAGVYRCTCVYKYLDVCIGIHIYTNVHRCVQVCTCVHI